MLFSAGRVLKIVLFVFGVTSLILLLIGFDEEESTHEKEINTNIGLYQVPMVPDSLEFCGEPVPLHDADVYEDLQRELIINNYWHSQTIQHILKAGRYFPVIEPILEQYNIPEDFKYLAVAESSLDNVTSPAGAKGFWQILELTAGDYNLEVNKYVDERYHLEKATEAACKFLNESHKKYGNWTMVAASYNVGRRGVDRQMNVQHETNYYKLLFNDETARYVFRILALKLVMESPENYGFEIHQNELYRPFEYKEIKVNESISDLALWAQEHNTTYKSLKILNPWLRESSLANPSGKTYLIRIPD